MNDQPKPDAERRARALAQVQPIIEAAEQAATGIIEEAEAQARKQVEEARARADRVAQESSTDMWALTDQLIARAETVKRESDELLEALNRTRRGIGAPAPSPAAGPTGPAAGPSPPPVPRPPTRPTIPRHPEPPAATSPSPAAAKPLSEGARLLATQMAVAGGSREEIAKRLSADFGIEDTDAMLYSILGDEG